MTAHHEINYAERERRLQENPTRADCLRMGSTHHAYNWSATPYGGWTDERVDDYFEGYAGALLGEMKQKFGNVTADADLLDEVLTRALEGDCTVSVHSGDGWTLKDSTDRVAIDQALKQADDVFLRLRATETNERAIALIVGSRLSALSDLGGAAARLLWDVQRDQEARGPAFGGR